MVAGLRSWRDAPARRDAGSPASTTTAGRSTARRAPLGVVGFVFEGRPNVFADATGVLRTGNTVVLRIGSDALGTAGRSSPRRSRPALAAAGLPDGAVSLVRSPRGPPAGRCSTTAAWPSPSPAAPARPSPSSARSPARPARRSACTARAAPGSSPARPPTPARFGAAVAPLARPQGLQHAQRVLHPGRAPRARGGVPRRRSTRRPPPGHDRTLHVDAGVAPRRARRRGSRRSCAVERADGVHDEPFATEIADGELGREWEWERDAGGHARRDRRRRRGRRPVQPPQPALRRLADQRRRRPSTSASTTRSTPRSSATASPAGSTASTRSTRPELGLSNWQDGRLFGRGGVLSGDSVHTVRYRATVDRPDLHR